MIKKIFRKLYLKLFIDFPLNIIISVKRSGVIMLLWLSDYTSRKIFFGFEYEKKDVDFIKTFLMKDDVIIDIGANIGYYSLVLSKIVGDNGKVYAFEPNKRSNLMLKLSATLNNINNIDIYDNVLSDKSNKKFSMIDFTDSTINYFKESINLSNEEQYVASTLDDILLFSSKLNKKIRFIKIDVEGAELKVLEGSKNILQNKFKPEYILIETYIEFSRRFGYEPEELYNYLYNLGYTNVFYLKNNKTYKVYKKDFNAFIGNVFFQYS